MSNTQNTSALEESVGATTPWQNNPTGQQSQSAPSMVYFTNTAGASLFYCAFLINNEIFITTSPDGINWGKSYYIGENSNTSPSLTVYNGSLYCAFIANNTTNAIQICYTQDGSNWSPNQTGPGLTSEVAPSLFVYNNILFCAYVSSTDGSSIYTVNLTSSGWGNPTNTNLQSEYAPSFAQLGYTLYTAYATSGNGLCIASSTSCTVWNTISTTTNEVYAAPTLSTNNNRLFCSYIDINTEFNVCINYSLDGINWIAVPMIGQQTDKTPSIFADCNNSLYLVYLLRDGTHNIDCSCLILSPCQRYITPTTTSTFTFVINDSGSRANDDISLWEPSSMPVGSYFVGHYGTPTEEGMPTTGFVYNGNDYTCLAPAQSYNLIYNYYVVVYQPIAPLGYVAIGIVGCTNNQNPSVDPSTLQNYMCVRQDLAVQVNPSDLKQLYNDSGTGQGQNITLWTLPNSGCLVASTGQDGSLPTGIVWDMKLT
jgi:hypothetical protein